MREGAGHGVMVLDVEGRWIGGEMEDLTQYC